MTEKVYLDANGKPIKVYLDENGNPVPSGQDSPTAEARKGPLGRILTGAASEVFGTENEPLPPAIAQDLSTAMTIGGAAGGPRGQAGMELIAPAIMNIIGQAQAGNYPGAAGAVAAEAATLGGAGLVDKLRGRLRFGPMLSEVTNPTERRALNWAEAHGIPMTAGQRTGRPGVQHYEQSLEFKPGSEATARGAYDATAEALGREARTIAEGVSPVQTSSYEVGKGISDRLSKIVTNLKSGADQLYDRVRAATSAATVSKQTGTQKLSVLLPSGQPATAPVMSIFEAPVDLRTIRGQLSGVYEELSRTLPEGRKAYSQGYQALRNVMENGEPFMNAMDFDRFLSAVKSITREGKSELLSTKSQGLAKEVIAQGEREFQKAINAVGPDTAKQLRTARDLVKKYHDIDEFRLDLGEPGAIYNRLISGGDRMVDTLRELKKLSPGDVRTTARTFLEDMITKATQEGGFSRSAGIKRDWERLPEETKHLLFGADRTSALDQFLLAAKRLERPGGSRTAPMLASEKYGAPLLALGEIITGVSVGHPGAGVAAAGATIGGAYFLPKVMAQLLMTPGGAKAMTRVIEMPFNRVQGMLAAQTVRRMVQGIIQRGEGE